MLRAVVNLKTARVINDSTVERGPCGKSGGGADRFSPDRDVFSDLSARVYRLCLAMLGSEPDACEAAQEALARSWLRRTSKRAGVSWWTWAGGFAVRVCREVHRRRRASVSTRSLADVLSELEGVSSHSGVESGLDLEAVREAIAALPDRQREVTVLRFLLGLSTREAAEMLGCPEGTVKSNLHKALARLRATVRP